MPVESRVTSLPVPSVRAWLKRSGSPAGKRRGISPRIVVETEDRAMMHHFAMEGVGMGPVPGIIASDVARQFRLELVGWLPGVREHYFAVSVARKQHHPAIVEIREQSRKGLLFQGLDPGDRGEESEST